MTAQLESMQELAPGPHYLELLSILERGDMPRGEQLYEAFAHDRVLGFVYCRIIDYLVYMQQRGVRFRRIAFDDSCSIELAAAEAAFIAQ